MMLRYSFDMAAEADAIERAVDKTLRSGFRCGDIMQENCQLVAARPWVRRSAAVSETISSKLLYEPLL